MPPRKLLIVDDMDSIRALVAAIGRDAGFEVHQANNGEQALFACQTIAFDVVLCDQNMPKMSGEAFVAKLRESDKGTPVIMLTGENDREKVAALVSVGINGFIRKPFKPDQIYKALDGVKARPAAARATPAAPPAPPAEAPDAAATPTDAAPTEAVAEAPADEAPTKV
ncbi:MAG: response regulator [Denitromonas halophila]|nr:MAG: response regulator [Denitromonas halophila]